MITFCAISPKTPDTDTMEVIVGGRVVGTLRITSEHYIATVFTNPGDIGTGFAIGTVPFAGHIGSDAVRVALARAREMQIAAADNIHALAAEVGP